ALSGFPAATARAEDNSATAVAHPLLRGLARDIRELQQRLPAAATDTRHRLSIGEVMADDNTATSRPEPVAATLLEQLQAHLRDDRWPPVPCPGDDSVQVHACHGPARQVEVLRECLLGLFAADPTLEP